jgi:DNA-binding GntR family transcriptional regulator
MPRTKAKRKVPRGAQSGMVYDEIKALIRGQEIGFHRPISENDVARRLAVSRTPVREALLRLKSEGWLTNATGQGLSLRQATESDVEEIYVLREALEGAAAKLAAKNATQSELIAIRELARAFESAVQREAPLEQLDQINAHFHSLLYRSSHSALLGKILEPLHLATNRFQQSIFTYPARTQESAKEHTELAEVLAANDSEAAERIARQHVRRAREIRAQLIAEHLVHDNN